MASALVLLCTGAILGLSNSVPIARANGAEPADGNGSRKVNFTIDFTGYPGGSVSNWLRTRGFRFEKDARDHRLLRLSVVNNELRLEAAGRLRGFILNESVNLETPSLIRISWGIIQYPKEVSYVRRVNNEALMLYIFFGKERVPNGSILIPDSPYFIGLFLCEDEEVNFPYKGRYFHTGGRFVCLGKPKPNETLESEFDLSNAFKTYFGRSKTPGITGIALSVDTSSAGNGGTAGAFIKRIEFAKGR